MIEFNNKSLKQGDKITIYKACGFDTTIVKTEGRFLECVREGYVQYKDLLMVKFIEKGDRKTTVSFFKIFDDLDEFILIVKGWKRPDPINKKVVADNSGSGKWEINKYQGRTTQYAIDLLDIIHCNYGYFALNGKYIEDCRNYLGVYYD